ncbi:MAG: carbohydrate kinase family protein [Fidelibacterota bacterium]|nr:MAG: carbohydrate kinase family protein [Candidatus Neomarinimicrobiota bacterium]
MSEFDVVVVGELNVDLILQDVSSLPEMGKEKLAEGMELTMGSASAILASNLARLGVRVGFAGKLGRDRFAEVVLATLEERGVDTGGITQDADARTGITVSMTFPDNYAMVTYMGVMEEYSLEEVPLDYVLQGRHLHLSSFYLQPGLRPGCAELFQRAKEAGLSTSFDPGWDPQEEWAADIKDVLPFVDVFLPNEQEALSISDQSTVAAAISELGGYSPVVVIKQGSGGAVCLAEGESIKTGIYTVNSVDTTGAGDSFNAGFLYEWLGGKDIHQSLKSGSACGALATTKLGGSTASPTIQELESFLDEYRDEPIFVDQA